MKILLTCFDPFGGETVNAAEEALKLVKGERCGAELVKLTVPTVFFRCIALLEEEIGRVRPDAVLCVGQAGGRCELSLERVAINLMDAKIPDNAGYAPVDEKIFADGKDAYFTTLPVKAMAAAIRDVSLPAQISYSAGTFVCNQLMYGLLYTLEKRFPGVRGGFMHIPFSPAQAAKRGSSVPSMSPSDVARGIEAAIGAIVHGRPAPSASEGAIC